MIFSVISGMISTTLLGIFSKRIINILLTGAILVGVLIIAYTGFNKYAPEKYVKKFHKIIHLEDYDDDDIAADSIRNKINKNQAINNIEIDTLLEKNKIEIDKLKHKAQVEKIDYDLAIQKGEFLKNKDQVKYQSQIILEQKNSVFSNTLDTIEFKIKKILGFIINICTFIINTIADHLAGTIIFLAILIAIIYLICKKVEKKFNNNKTSEELKNIESIIPIIKKGIYDAAGPKETRERK